MAEKEGYRHYMLKEIHEQPRAVRDTFNGRMFEESGEVFFNDLQFTPEEWAKFRTHPHRRLRHVVALGAGRQVPARERGADPGRSRLRLGVPLSRSDHRRDARWSSASRSPARPRTRSPAMQEAKAKGAKLISICNVIGAAATRMSDGVIYTNAGPEIGVASTKAFTTQLTAFYLLSLYIRQLRGDDKDDIRYAMHELSTIPHKIEHLLKTQEKKIEQLANKYHNAQDFLFLGRGVHYPIALEGALKLKEISYIHAEGYPAGEMKHGPIALIDENMPVVAIATHTPVYDKVVSNLQEVKARDGKLIVICDEGDEEMQKLADDFIEVPWAIEPLQPILTVDPDAAAGVLHRPAPRMRRGSAAESGEERDGGVRRAASSRRAARHRARALGDANAAAPGCRRRSRHRTRARGAIALRHEPADQIHGAEDHVDHVVHVPSSSWPGMTASIRSAPSPRDEAHDAEEQVDRAED